ncbi:MAG: hypothetical protein QF362_02145 [Candidatus Woesearchaeota archaeon]|jgi:hypothetical protein|nr:hypothetical protein [Candidatus Woesearchaeota archaeon]
MSWFNKQSLGHLEEFIEKDLKDFLELDRFFIRSYHNIITYAPNKNGIPFEDLRKDISELARFADYLWLWFNKTDNNLRSLLSLLEKDFKILQRGLSKITKTWLITKRSGFFKRDISDKNFKRLYQLVSLTKNSISSSLGEIIILKNRLNSSTTKSFLHECKELLKNKGLIQETIRDHRQGMGQALRQYARYLKETNSKLESLAGLIVTPLRNILFEITEIDKNFEIIKNPNRSKLRGIFSI